MLYDYLAWMAGYSSTPSVEEPTELKEPPKVEEPPNIEELNAPPPSPEKKEEEMLSIAQLETEQENIVPVHSYLIYSKRNKRQRS